MDENPATEKQSGSQMKNKKGFRLWWLGNLGFIVFTALVIVLAGSRLMRRPLNQHYAAKNTLATIIKECAYSEARGGGTRPSDISRETAELTIRGYRISVGPTCYQATAKSNDNELSDFSLSHDDDGKTWSTCVAGEDPYGCFADEARTIDQEPGKPGYW